MPDSSRSYGTRPLRFKNTSLRWSLVKCLELRGKSLHRSFSKLWAPYTKHYKFIYPNSWFFKFQTLEIWWPHTWVTYPSLCKAIHEPNCKGGEGSCKPGKGTSENYKTQWRKHQGHKLHPHTSPDSCQQSHHPRDFNTATVLCKIEPVQTWTNSSPLVTDVERNTRIGVTLGSWSINHKIGAVIANLDGYSANDLRKDSC